MSMIDPKGAPRTSGGFSTESRKPEKQKENYQTRDPRTDRPPPPLDVEKIRKQKSRIELEENEDLEIDEGIEATDRNPETPDNTGAARQTDRPESQVDDVGADDEDVDDPEAIDEAMRNRDS